MKTMILIATLACTFLVACGGSGESTQGTDSPAVPSAATITSGNVYYLVDDVAMAVAMSITTRIGPYLSITSNIPPDVTAQQNGCVLGTATFALSRDGVNNVTGTGAYSGFDNCASWTLSGNAGVTGVLVADRVDTFFLSSTDFSYTRTGTTQTYHFSGTIELVWKPSVGGSAGYVLTVNGHVRNQNQTVVYTLENFQVDSNISAGQENILISGRVTDPTYGYIDLSATSRSTFVLPGDSIWSGNFLITGAGATATLTYTDGVPIAFIN